jgi:hypothetical protein
MNSINGISSANSSLFDLSSLYKTASGNGLSQSNAVGTGVSPNTGTTDYAALLGGQTNPAAFNLASLGATPSDGTLMGWANSLTGGAASGNAGTAAAISNGLSPNGMGLGDILGPSNPNLAVVQQDKIAQFLQKIKAQVKDPNKFNQAMTTVLKAIADGKINAPAGTTEVIQGLLGVGGSATPTTTGNAPTVETPSTTPVASTEQTNPAATQQEVQGRAVVTLLASLVGPEGKDTAKPEVFQVAPNRTLKVGRKTDEKGQTFVVLTDEITGADGKVQKKAFQFAKAVDGKITISAADGSSGTLVEIDKDAIAQLGSRQYFAQQFQQWFPALDAAKIKELLDLLFGPETLVPPAAATSPNTHNTGGNSGSSSNDQNAGTGGALPADNPEDGGSQGSSNNHNTNNTGGSPGDASPPPPPPPPAQNTTSPLNPPKNKELSPLSHWEQKYFNVDANGKPNPPTPQQKQQQLKSDYYKAVDNDNGSSKTTQAAIQAAKKVTPKGYAIKI